jgi:hypothetical protein
MEIEYIDCAPCCFGCDRETDYIIYVCNSNAATDDNYRLILNGKNMGDIILNSNNCIGKFFRTNSTIEPTIDLLEPGISCCGNDPDNGTPKGMTRVTLNAGDLLEGRTNTLVMQNIQNNNNGNFGNVVVAGVYFDQEQQKWVMCRRFLNTFYSGGSGASFSFTFEMPDYS